MSRAERSVRYYDTATAKTRWKKKKKKTAQVTQVFPSVVGFLWPLLELYRFYSGLPLSKNNAGMQGLQQCEPVQDAALATSSSPIPKMRTQVMHSHSVQLTLNMYE